jgi:hypothetical protein
VCSAADASRRGTLSPGRPAPVSAGRQATSATVMTRTEKVLSTLCFLYVISYMVFFFIYASGPSSESLMILPLHLLAMLLSLVLIVLVVRDILKRDFPNPNTKVFWTLAVIWLWPIIPYYLWRHGFRPRSSARVV